MCDINLEWKMGVIHWICQLSDAVRFVCCTLATWKFVYTVWLEVLVGRYFGGLLKICHLAEFTLAVEPVSTIMIFIAKWPIDRAGNVIGPWASFRSVRTKSMIKRSWKLNKSLLSLIWTVFVPLVFTVTVYTSFGSPSSRWQTSQLFFHLRCTKLFGEAMSSYASFHGKLHGDDWTIGRWNIGELLSKLPTW